MTRLNPWTAAPDQMKLLVDYSMAATAGFDPVLTPLVKIRASQINGCALCLHMHIGEGRKGGETDPRMYLLGAWRDAPIYTARERAALAWTEALTDLSHSHAPDAAYEELKPHFSEAEIVQLTLLINVINSFNRLGVGFQMRPLGLPALAEAA